MATLESIRNKLQSKIFDPNKIASSMTVEQSTSVTADKWGDETITYGAATTVYAVPFNLLTRETYYVPFGELQDGEMELIVKYDQTITKNSRVTFNNVSYKVVRCEEYPFNSGIIAQIVRLKKTG